MFKGVITPMVTILDENKAIDFEGTTRVVEYLIQGGVDGLLILGSIGEFFAMKRLEKEAYVKHVIEVVGGRVPVLVGTGGTQVDDIISFSKFSVAAGADAVLIVSPYYFMLDDESLYRYYAQIASEITTPIMLYNFPDRTGHDLSPNLIRRLALDFEHIVGVKDTVDNISHTRGIIQAVKPVRADFCIFTGFDEYFIPNLMAGGDGLIGGISNFYPSLFKTLYAAYQQCDMQTVLTCQAKISGLMQVYAQTRPFVSAIKMAVKLAGLDIVPEVKAPGAIANTEETQAIDSLLKTYMA